MVINNRVYRITFFIFLVLAPALWAQVSSSYHIQTQEGDARFIQQLVWLGGEYALRYEVEIQKEEYGVYQDYLREFTTDLFIEVSLHPGIYRFRVIPYDVLNRPNNPSEWKEILILRAYRPELHETIPEVVMGRGNRPLGYTFVIQGSDIEPEAEILVRQPDGSMNPPRNIEYDDNDNIVLFFNIKDIEPGDYEVIIKNPGGLETSSGIITIDEPVKKAEKAEKAEKSGKSLGIMISAVWAPYYPIYGNDYGDGFSLTGATVRFAKVFRMPIGFYLAPELSASMYSLDMFAGGINFLAHKKLANEKIAVNIRFGGDFVFLPWNMDFNINTGMSLFVPLFSVLYLEAGVDYSNLFSAPFDISSGILRPFIGIGVQF